MRARLKAKVLRWKTTALKGTKSRSLLKAQLRRSQHRAAALEKKVAELEARAAPLRVPGHTYPAQLIALAVFIVVHANGSLRCAAKTVGFVARLLGWGFGTPSHTSVRRWVMRCGHFQLQQAARLSGDYVALLDESIQIGREKLLLLPGVKIEAGQSHCQPLRAEDVTVLGLEVQPSWTGQAVAAFLSRSLSRLPRLNVAYFITDGGTNLAKALSLSGYNAVSDCTHMLMNAVKKLLGKDTVLSQLHADVLAIPLYSVDITPLFVRQALLETPYSVVHEWEQLRTCENRYAQLRRMEQELKSDVP